jgi:branched-chain amino acid transport system substrate-binding protein
MNTHSRSRRALGIAVALALAVTVSACGGRDAGRSGDAAEGAPSPGITDTTVTLGITTPLSGPTAGPGTCTVAGVTAYFGAKNAAGGVEFGDGKTRTVEIQALDDTYDPQQAAANYDQLKGEVFAMTAGLGTPTNRA